MDLLASALSKGQATVGSSWAGGCKNTEVHRRCLPWNICNPDRTQKLRELLRSSILGKAERKEGSRLYWAGAQYQITMFSNMLLQLLIFPQMAGSFSWGSSQVTETLSISSCIRPNKSMHFSNTLPCSSLFEIGLTEWLWMMAVSWKISSACMQIPHKVRKLTNSDFLI